MSYQFYVPTRTLFGAGKLNELHTQDNARKESDGRNLEWQVHERNGNALPGIERISVCGRGDGDIWDYMNGGTGGGKTLTEKALPVICITTTAGTGSEADQWGVITNDETNEKIGFGGYDCLFPVLSVVDPELMVSVPPKFTAYQGFDALFHSTECYISKAHNRMGDMLALNAIENIGRYLVRAVKDGSDLEAREGVAFANNLSGQVMTVSCCTSEHSMEHAMSAYHQELPHGAGLIMISAAYYQHFVDNHACDERFITMAKALGKKDASSPQDFVDLLVQLQKDCGVYDLKMSDFGIQESELDGLAKNARETMGGLFTADPKELSHEECVAIYQKSYR